MESPERCRILVSWFPGCSDLAALGCLVEKAGVDGIEMRYLDDDALRLADAGVLVSFHLPTLPGEQVEINLASEEILAPYREGRMGLLELARVPFLGYHFGYSCLRVRKVNGPDEALSPTLSREETAERIGATVKELAAITGKEILVENMDYGPTGALEYVCEALFTREVCEQFGCRMLWDIGHGLVSAAAKKLSEEEYMGSYVEELAPYVREIHVNSPRGGKDAHLPATDHELSWLKRMLQAGTNPYAVVLERAWGNQRGLDFAEVLVSEVHTVREVLERA
jgi:uncharacterized protein (UPF0276 family)